MLVRHVFRFGCFVSVFLVALAAARAAADATPQPNRLIHEKSPYLRQHAFNPVDWYPWGEEAFAKARRDNKPIFLSIGYSTCHWCHVMARESFSDPEIAALLNANFVSIKVDREERPDVDRVYLTFVEASTGGGGWPLSVWLTPDLKPFLGGTYFAPESRDGHPGFKALLTKVAARWQSQHEEILKTSDQMLKALAADTRSEASAVVVPLAELRQRAFAQTFESFDADHGGFEPAPKFARPALLDFLFDLHSTSTDARQREQSLQMALKTLREIADGGIHDHLGGGFHRYSVDATWRVPHFEKMLYDQAQLASVLLSAWLLSGDPALKAAAQDTLDYVRRDLTDPAGGFYSAEDADSARGSASGEHTEGAFYVWTAAEIEKVLAAKDAAIFGFAFGVKPVGNAAAEELAGENVLYRAHSVAECAVKFALTPEGVRAAIETATKQLRAAREARPRPLRDDKVITAWNGLTISAFARAGQVLGDPAYTATAERAAVFLRDHLYDPTTGRLARSFRDRVRDDRGFAEDYAFLIQGLLDLYEATFDVRWIEWAIQLQEKQNELFLDKVGGGYFANTNDDARVLLRLKESEDGVEPAPSSIAVRNLARLSSMFHRDDWRELAAQTGRAFGPVFERTPNGMPQMLAALAWLEGSPKQILIQGPADADSTARLVHEVWSRFLPHRVLLRIDAASRPFFAAKLPIVADLPAEVGVEATAYVCANFVCQLPTQDPAMLAKLLSAGPSGGP